MTGPPPFRWTPGSIHPEVLLGVTLLGLAYAAAWARRGGRPGPDRGGYGSECDCEE